TRVSRRARIAAARASSGSTSSQARFGSAWLAVHGQRAGAPLSGLPDSAGHAWQATAPPLGTGETKRYAWPRVVESVCSTVPSHGARRTAAGVSAVPRRAGCGRPAAGLLSRLVRLRTIRAAGVQPATEIPDRDESPTTMEVEE